MAEQTRLSHYLSQPLILINQGLETSTDLFQAVHREALALGYVREDFGQRVAEREATFPTGLQLEKLGAAIPHTDAECVLQEFVAVVVNEDPIPFQSMEDPSQSVDASLVFVLGLNQPHAQLEMLQSLMGILQNNDLLQEFLQAKTSQELLTIVQKNNL